ncbi:MAG: FecR domain-containing protein [Planctomycetota bacterium]
MSSSAHSNSGRGPENWDREDWDRILHRHLDGRSSEDECAVLSTRLESDPEFRRDYLRMAEMHATLMLGESLSPSLGDVSLGAPTTHRSTWPVSLVAIAALILVGLILFRPGADPKIGRLLGSSGEVRWTGAGGRIATELVKGARLGGGTLETMSADSTAKFQFDSGANVVISGATRMTVSDQYETSVHLRHGGLTLTCDALHDDGEVVVQTPASVIHASTGKLEVYAGPSSTKVIVHDGAAEFKRRSDGRILLLPAFHWAKAEMGSRQEMIAYPLNRTVRNWKASLRDEVQQGRWVSSAEQLRTKLLAIVELGEITPREARREYSAIRAEMGDGAGSLQATPRILGRGDDAKTVHAVMLNIASERAESVLLSTASQFRIRGRVKSRCEVSVGFSAVGKRRRDSESSRSDERVSTSPRPDAKETGARYSMTAVVDGEFEISVDLSDFHEMGRPGVSAGRSAPDRKLVNWWCMTDSDAARLEITDVEMNGGSPERTETSTGQPGDTKRIH